MPNNINLQSTLNTFYAANKSNKTVVTNPKKDGGVSVKGWKLNLRSAVGADKTQAGNFASKGAQATTGQAASNAGAATNTPLETLYSAIEQQLKPELGNSTDFAIEKAKETFKTQGDVTLEKFESFSESLTKAIKHKTEQRRTGLKDLSDGKFDTTFVKAKSGTVDTLLRMLIGEKVPELGVDIVFPHHEAGHYLSDYEAEIMDKNTALFDLCKGSLQYFDDMESALDYQFTHLDDQDPDYDLRAASIARRIQGVVSDRDDFITKMGAKLGELPQERFTGRTEEAVENPVVEEFEPVSPLTTYQHKEEFVAGKSIQRSADSEFKDDIQFDSTIKLHIDDEPDGIDRTSAKKDRKNTVDALVQEIAYTLDLSYRADDDSLDEATSADKSYHYGRAFKEGINQTLRLKSQVNFGINDIELQQMKDLLQHPAFQDVDAFLEEADRAKFLYSLNFQSFDPQFQEACDAYDDAAKALAESQESGRNLRSNVKHSHQRGLLKEEVNEGGVKVVGNARALMEAEDRLDDLKLTVSPNQVALRERYEAVVNQQQAADMVKTAKDKLTEFIAKAEANAAKAKIAEQREAAKAAQNAS